MLILLLFVLLNPFLCLGEKAALILARGGSKGVHLKNLQAVGGVSLLARAIKTAKRAGLDVTVSTDHPLVALEALKHNAHVFLRSKVTATDWAPSIWGAAEFIDSRPGITVLALIQATSPFLRAQQLLRAVDEVDRFDCVFSVTRSFKLRWRQINGQVAPLNFNINSRPRRQDWNGELLETGAFYVTRTWLIEDGYFQNNNCSVIELSPTESWEVDSHHDLQVANALLSAVSRLPPKRVVVGGGSPRFLQRRRAALHRWLTLVARHPVLAHDADLRSFLTETTLRLDKPKHDEFLLAGTQGDARGSMPTEEMQAAFVSEQEQLRLVQLGLGRLYQIFERVESRCESELSDMRELGAGLNALSAPAVGDSARWANIRRAMKAAAELAIEVGESPPELDVSEDGPCGRMLLAVDALQAWRELCARLTRGLHGERSAAALAAPHSAASQLLRARHRYAMQCSLEEARIARAYALTALESLPELFRAHGSAHARGAALWTDLHTALKH